MVDPMLPVPHRIRQLRRETHDTFTMELEPADGSPLMSFRAGQFNMLYAFGVGEVAISISGNPASDKALVHTVRAVGTVTNAISRLKRGDVLGGRGPFGNPWPLAEAEGKDVVIVTGGVGLAPLRSVMYHVIAHRPGGQPIGALEAAFAKIGKLIRRALPKSRYQRAEAA